MTPVERAWLSLDGLSVGDTFGERFFGPPEEVTKRIAARTLPPSPWSYTDDTEMARRSNDFAEALWETVSALGDRDTTCAIVGGIVAVHAGAQSIPPAWLEAREHLPLRRPPPAAPS